MDETEFSHQSATTGLDLHDPGQRAQIERAIESLPGVLTVRIVAGYDRPVDELHALVSVERSPKQVVRDVQSLLFTRFDLNIDHRVISVVQLDADDPILVDQVSSPDRIALARVSVTQAASETSVTVVIADGDGIEHVGTATSQASVTGLRSASAQATLQALEELAGEGTTAALQALDIVDANGTDVVLAVVSARVGRSEMVLTGSAQVRRGETDAIARAILDALNRLMQTRD